MAPTPKKLALTIIITLAVVSIAFFLRINPDVLINIIATVLLIILAASFLGRRQAKKK